MYYIVVVLQVLVMYECLYTFRGYMEVMLCSMFNLMHIKCNSIIKVLQLILMIH